jgi:hypothetical protein
LRRSLDEFTFTRPTVLAEGLEHLVAKSGLHATRCSTPTQAQRKINKVLSEGGKVIERVHALPLAHRYTPN